MPHIQKRLAKLGVQTWELARPQVLKGEVAISIHSTIKLIIVLENTIDLHEPLLNDLIRSIGCHHNEMMLIRIEQLALLGSAIRKNPNPKIWLMTDLIDTSAYCEHSMRINAQIKNQQDNEQLNEHTEENIELINTFTNEFSHRITLAPSIASLKHLAHAKQTFWQAIAN